MKHRILIIVASVLVSILAGGVAWADRPACPVEAGACFVDLGAYWGVVMTLDGGWVWTYSEEPNDRIHFNANRARVHGIYPDVIVMYCPPDVVAEDLCDPLDPDPRVFNGTGTLHVNLDLNGGATCPTSLHLQGEVYSPGGAAFDLRVNLVKVPDPHSELGCRDVQREITLALVP